MRKPYEEVGKVEPEPTGDGHVHDDREEESDYDKVIVVMVFFVV
jgi:hypothetical protein